MDIKGYDLRDIPAENVNWIWEGFIAEGMLTLCASPPKAGKSTLLWHLLKASSVEAPFLGLRTRQVPTVIFTEESFATLTERRDYLALADAPIHAVTIQPGLSWPTLIGYTKDRVVRHGARLVVLDTVSRFWGLRSEDDAAEQLTALGPLFVLARHFNLGVLLIHHTRKSRGAEGRAVRGSNALTGAVDIIMEFGRLSPYDVSNTRRIDSLSRFSATPDRLVASLGPEGYAVTDASEGRLEGIVLRLVASREGVTANDVAEEAEVSERAAQRTLSQLVARGIIARHGSGNGTSPFTYTIGGGEDGE